jgi:hypothetical protein
MDVIVDLFQYSRIALAEAQASQAKTEVDRLRLGVQNLQRRSDALVIACQALWELVRDRDGITDHDLLARMQEIDLRDGRQDGKISGSTQNCTRCGRTSNAARSNCLYCGEVMPGSHVFGKSDR